MSGKIVPIEMADDIRDEKSKRVLAATFDRLIDSNLQLTTSVGRLVNAVYLLMIVQILYVALTWRR